MTKEHRNSLRLYIENRCCCNPSQSCIDCIFYVTKASNKHGHCLEFKWHYEKKELWKELIERERITEEEAFLELL